MDIIESPELIKSMPPKSEVEAKPESPESAQKLDILTSDAAAVPIVPVILAAVSAPAPVSESKKESSEDKKDARGKETLFRATYMNQINLIQMADNKANMIISINTMIISAMIAITGYGAAADKLAQDSTLIIPVVLIVMTCLVSVIFAIQAARPKLIKASKFSPSTQAEKSSLLFFGVIATHTQKSYLEKMEQLIASKKEIYETMAIDLYNQGKILKRKYNLLSYAYKVFMFGFVFSVVIFLLFIALK